SRAVTRASDRLAVRGGMRSKNAASALAKLPRNHEGSRLSGRQLCSSYRRTLHLCRPPVLVRAVARERLAAEVTFSTFLSRSWLFLRLCSVGHPSNRACLGYRRARASTPR